MKINFIFLAIILIVPSFNITSIPKEYTWSISDNYHYISCSYTNSSEKSDIFISDNMQYIIEYDYISQIYGQMYLNASSLNSSINRIIVNVSYPLIHAVIQNVFNGNHAIMNIYSVISKYQTHDTNATIRNIYLGDINLYNDKIPIFSNIGILGSTEIFFMSGSKNVFNFTYTFSFVKPFIIHKDKISDYTNIGIKLSVLKEGDFDGDGYSDLLLKKEVLAYFSDLNFSVNFPLYLDGSSIASQLANILFYIGITISLDKIGYLPITAYIPSGISVLHGSVEQFIYAFSSILPDFGKEVIVESIKNGSISKFIELSTQFFLTNHKNWEMNPSFFYNGISFISLGSLLIMPKNINLENLHLFTQTISDNLITTPYGNDIKSSMSIKYMMANLLSYSKKDNLTTIEINGNYLPILRDLHNGPFAISNVTIKWNGEILTDFSINLDYINATFGRTIGVHLYEPKKIRWDKRIIISIIAISTFFGFGVFIYKRKNKSNKINFELI